MNLSEYRFDRPLLITSQHELPLAIAQYESGEAWIKTLKETPNLVAAVLPLELRARDNRYQDLFGLELFNWLRWSVDEPLSLIPVLVAAFQPLEAILKRSLDLLAVASGSTFCRLPHGVSELLSFLSRARSPDHPMAANAYELGHIASVAGYKATELTYHDLANDYYFASRLWAGYKSAIDVALNSADVAGAAKTALRAAQERALTTTLSWDESLKARLLQPHVRLYLRQLKRQSRVPDYRDIANASELFASHISNGMPYGTRILLVDDEFDKGLGEILWRILFSSDTHTVVRTHMTPDEHVYSETNREGRRWARLVCVKDGTRAKYWLGRWHELDLERVGAEASGQGDRKHHRKGFSVQTVAKQPETAFDDPDVDPKVRSTIAILDLRLKGDESVESANLRSFESLRLRRLIKEQNDALPIIMMTASRQALTYAAVMEDASDADGWLTKEGPDALGPDRNASDLNSARAVHYLLQRLGIFGSMRTWYNPAQKWTMRQMLDVGELRSNPSIWSEALNNISGQATRLLARLGDPTFATDRANVSGLAWVDDIVANLVGKQRVLVLRLVFVALLLSTSDWSGRGPRWNIPRFAMTLPGYNLPGSSAGARAAKLRRYECNAAHDVVNFKEQLWLCTSRESLLSLLMREELDWLKDHFSTRNPDVKAFLDDLGN